EGRGDRARAGPVSEVHRAAWRTDLGAESARQGIDVLVHVAPELMGINLSLWPVVDAEPRPARSLLLAISRSGPCCLACLSWIPSSLDSGWGSPPQECSCAVKRSAGTLRRR